MKKEYDFSKAERGKFYKAKARLKLPVYLDPEVEKFVAAIARRKRTDASDVVNRLLRTDMRLAREIE